MRNLAIAATIGLSASTVLAQDFGGQQDKAYAAELWQIMLQRDLVGDQAIQAFPYEGTDPHGMMLETFNTEALIDNHPGKLIIKRNYGPEGVTAGEVLESPQDHLESVTIMFRRSGNFAPNAENWFWAKYLPDGSLDQSADDTPLAGMARGCISCRASADGGDYVFTTNAGFD